MATTAFAAPGFDLKVPRAYFSDEKVLALLDAAISGDSVKAKQMVAAGADPNTAGPPGTAGRIRLLHYAIAAKNSGAVIILMALGADPELDTPMAGPALLFAITLDDVDMLARILQARPYSSLSRGTVKTLMFQTVLLPRPRCLMVLLKQGFPIDFKNDAGFTVMMDAISTQDYDLAEWLLNQGASVKIDTPSGITPANSVQFHLNKFVAGSPTHSKVLRLKSLMEQKGAVFPAMSPKEVRALRGQQ